MDGWLTRYNLEIAAAKAARMDGNEGRARVCARRALGIAIAEYYRKSNQEAAVTGLYPTIARMAADPHIPKEWVELLEHFTVRVNPDGSLPIEVDLVDEVERFSRLTGLCD